jgi:hypothetical protein
MRIGQVLASEQLLREARAEKAGTSGDYDAHRSAPVDKASAIIMR